MTKSDLAELSQSIEEKLNKTNFKKTNIKINKSATLMRTCFMD
jgi:hypothetical protein